MKKRIFGILAIAALLIGFAGVPASASYASCPADKLCTYKGFGGSGDQYYYSVVNGCISIGASWNDKILSVWNRTSKVATFYNDAGCANGILGRENWYSGDQSDVSLWSEYVFSSIKFS